MKPNQASKSVVAPAKPSAEKAPSLTPVEFERAKALFHMRNYCAAQLEKTEEGKAFAVANTAMTAFEAEMAAKYSLAAPYEIGPSGEIVMSPRG